MNSPDPWIEERYLLAGKGLSNYLIRIRDEWRGVHVLGAFPDFCGRLYHLVYDEWLSLRESVDELGRQSNWLLYATPFWTDLTDNITWDASLPQNDQEFAKILIACLERICNAHL